ncbi:hypothetical protein [Dysgonomonas sp. 25]|uniref:hypothetical protein n=1 Tax=Dysgonomonas sp. 25 TaxID=2302933 RepID=UPI0013D48E32|nr:hypothetical protein [Dysgonomonas sp. 25]NDV70032.1 hypothetical protein [Dysgonomonas sp. 25]
MERLRYNFFNGVQLYKNLVDKLFQPVDGKFDIFSKAYIEVNEVRHTLWKGGSKALSTFRDFTKEQLEEIAEKYDLKVTLSDYKNPSDNDYYIYLNGSATIPYIIQTDAYDILYSIGGSRGPEDIYIYGVFKK